MAVPDRFAGQILTDRAGRELESINEIQPKDPYLLPHYGATEGRNSDGQTLSLDHRDGLSGGEISWLPVQALFPPGVERRERVSLVAAIRPHVQYHGPIHGATCHDRQRDRC